MMHGSPRHRLSVKPGLELIEEAVHLLRVSPAAVLWPYYLGAIPFVLGLLYFWTEMSGSAYAERHLPEASLGLALLFTWMKFWQNVFATHLRTRLEGGEPALPGFRNAVKAWITQTWIHATGLFLLPLAFLTVLGFTWVFAFYQSVTAQTVDTSRSRTTVRQAHRLALLFPGQNHVVLGLLAAFSLCVFLNWGLVCYLVPQLAKILFGIDSLFTRSGTHVFNTTFLAVALGLTYLSVDPILKAVYALRCFYGEALESGEDLAAELRRLRSEGARPLAALVAAVMLVVALGTGQVQAAETPAPPSGTPVLAPGSSSIEPGQLDAAIEKVIQQRKYAWRMPREKLEASDSDRGIIARFFTSVFDTTVKYLRQFRDWLKKSWDKLFPDRSRGPNMPSGTGFGSGSLVLLYALLAAVLISLALFAMRYVRLRRAPQNTLAAEPIQPVPDLGDENVGAEQMAEDGWMRLGREMLAKGEFRLAMRAFYLSSLAWLAQNNLVNLARFKSNRDYQRELARRAHALPNTVQGFGQTVETFERVWYGSHPADLPMVEGFLQQIQQLREGGNA